MYRIEDKLRQIWGTQSLQFCTSCGLPAEGPGANCDHGAMAPWSELNNRQRTYVRWQTIQAVKAVQTTAPARLTVAS